MKNVLFLFSLVLSFATLHAQEIDHSTQILISKQTPIAIWKVMGADTSYYVVYNNYKYQVLKDQSSTKLTLAQLKQFSALLQKMSESQEVGQSVSHIDAGLIVEMNRNRRSYRMTVYDLQERYVDIAPLHVRILIKDISSQ